MSELQGQMSIFDLLPKESKFTRKSCTATLKDCDCHCGVAECCQNCPKPCENRCGYSKNQYEVFDRELKEWIRNPDYFNPIWELAWHGSGFRDGKKRIKDYFLENHTAKEKAEFLKDEYGIGGFGSPHEGKKNFLHFAMADSKGIKIKYLDRKGENQEGFVTWQELAKEILFLVSKEWY